MINAIDPAIIPSRNGKYRQLIEDFLASGEAAAEVSLEGVSPHSVYCGLMASVRYRHFNVYVVKRNDKVYLMKK